jgi:hypothetical protein
MAARYKPTEIRPIWYRRTQRSLRTRIVFTVINAIVAGFLLGVTLLQYVLGRTGVSWLTLLVITCSSAVTTLRGIFDALRDCPRPSKTAGGEATLHNASA